MDTSKKYRRFGIGALIVLGVVILIAIIVIANTLNKTPKASTEDTNQPTVAKTEDKKDEKKDEKKETKKEETKPAVVEDNKSAEVDTKSMPSTGPEDAVLPIVLIAASAYLVSLNANWAKRGLRDEEQA